MGKKLVTAALVVALFGCGPSRRYQVTVFTVTITNTTTVDMPVTVQADADPPKCETVLPGCLTTVTCDSHDPDQVVVTTHKGSKVYKKHHDYDGIKHHLDVDAD